MSYSHLNFFEIAKYFKEHPGEVMDGNYVSQKLNVKKEFVDPILKDLLLNGILQESNNGFVYNPMNLGSGTKALNSLLDKSAGLIEELKKVEVSQQETAQTYQKQNKSGVKDSTKSYRGKT